MRLGHLTDNEVQLWLDYNASEKSALTRERAREMRVHLDNCYQCREQASAYADFMNELKAEPHDDLSRSFARKVTLALPPFRESRRRSIRRVSLIWGVASLLMLGWIMTRLNWGSLAVWTGRNLGVLVEQTVSYLSMTWDTLAILAAYIPLPSVDWSFVRRVQAVLVDQPELIILTLVSAIALLLVSVVDNMIAGNLTSRR